MKYKEGDRIICDTYGGSSGSSGISGGKYLIKGITRKDIPEFYKSSDMEYYIIESLSYNVEHIEWTDSIDKYSEFDKEYYRDKKIDLILNI